jgi:hypothetical protein
MREFRDYVCTVSKANKCKIMPKDYKESSSKQRYTTKLKKGMERC